MRRSLIVTAVVLSAASALGVFVQVGKNGPGWDGAKTRYKLYNGWFLSPVGRRVTLDGDMPGPIVLSSDGRYALVGTHGYNDHSLTVIDRQTGEISDSKKVNRSSFGLAVAGDLVLSSGGASAGTAARPDIRAIIHAHPGALGDGLVVEFQAAHGLADDVRERVF